MPSLKTFSECFTEGLDPWWTSAHDKARGPKLRGHFDKPPAAVWSWPGFWKRHPPEWPEDVKTAAHDEGGLEVTSPPPGAPAIDRVFPDESDPGWKARCDELRAKGWRRTGILEWAPPA